MLVQGATLLLVIPKCPRALETISDEIVICVMSKTAPLIEPD